MIRRCSLAALLAATVVAGAPAATSDEAHVADLVARSALWLGRSPGFAELRATAYAPRLLREVMRLTLLRGPGDVPLLGAVLDPVPISDGDTPRQLARRVLSRTEALPHHQYMEFLGLVARVAPASPDPSHHDRLVADLLADAAPTSPFLLDGAPVSRVASDAELKDMAYAILDSLWEAARTREEPGGLPLGIVADRLLEE